MALKSSVKSNAVLGAGAGLLIGYLIYLPFARNPWYEYPTLWFALGLIVASAVHYRKRH